MANQKIVDVSFTGFLGRFNASIGVALFYFIFYLPYATFLLVISYSLASYGFSSAENIYQDIYFSAMVSYAIFMVAFGSVTSYEKLTKKLIIRASMTKKIDFRFFELTLIVAWVFSLYFLASSR